MTHIGLGEFFRIGDNEFICKRCGVGMTRKEALEHKCAKKEDK